MNNFDFVPFLVSFELATWVTVILLVAVFPLAWVFGRSKRGWMPFVEALCSVGLVLPPTVLGFYLLVAFSPNNFIGAFFLKTFGFRIAFSFPGMVVAASIAGLPFMLSALRAGSSSVPQNLLEASWTLGKSRAATVVRVGVPNMKGAILAGVVTTFAHTLGEFGVVLMIGGSIPGVTKVVSVAIYEQWEAGNDMQAHLYAVVLLVISYAGVLAMNLAQRRESRGRA